MIYEVKISSTPPIMSMGQVMHRLNLTYNAVHSMICMDKIDVCYPFPTVKNSKWETPAIFIVVNDRLQYYIDQYDKNQKLHKRFLKAVEKTNKMMEGNI